MGADAIRAAGQTDPSGREDAGSFTKEHQGTLHFFTVYQCKYSSFIKQLFERIFPPKV